MPTPFAKSRIMTALSSSLSAPVLFAIQAVVVVLFSSHPFEGLGVVTWPLAFTVTYWLLRLGLSFGLGVRGTPGFPLS